MCCCGGLCCSVWVEQFSGLSVLLSCVRMLHWVVSSLFSRFLATLRLLLYLSACFVFVSALFCFSRSCMFCSLPYFPRGDTSIHYTIQSWPSSVICSPSLCYVQEHERIKQNLKYGSHARLEEHERINQNHTTTHFVPVKIHLGLCCTSIPCDFLIIMTVNLANTLLFWKTPFQLS